MADLQAHVDAAVAKALAAAKGDTARAQRLLIRAAAGDPKLLAGLAQPFLAGITAHALQRASGQAPAAAPTAKRRRSGPAAKKDLTPEAFDAMVGQLGRRIGTSRAPEGMSALVEEAQPTRAGTGHEQTLRAMATAFARQRLDRRVAELDRLSRAKGSDGAA
ncbi:MAG: hypothetical protein GVY28_01455 [Alphaproteobacteria bacterium]|jgi:hypothetical protein|nr:hypothetical protein [Alphaproteobacteria bacterium]